MNRERLAQRRAHEVLEFVHGGIRYTAGVGRYEDGRLAEVFLDAGKAGTDVQTAARDGAVSLSLLLQHGCAVDTIRGALTREPDGVASGPLGRLLDLLEHDAESGPRAA